VCAGTRDKSLFGSFSSEKEQILPLLWNKEAERLLLPGRAALGGALCLGGRAGFGWEAFEREGTKTTKERRSLPNLWVASLVPFGFFAAWGLADRGIYSRRW
jgi:hypothetical protein